MHQHSPLRICLAALLALSAAACGDDGEGPAPIPDAAIGEDSGAPTSIDGGVDSGGVDGGATIATGIAVVATDYQSASVSLLDREGNLLADGCLHSGSGAAGLATTLSGDVVSPSQVTAGGPIAIIDRANAAITWIDAATCAVRAQLGVGTGFKSNPQDVVTLSPTKAYVVRQDANAKPTPVADDFDEGNDVLIVDPTQPKITGRIDLAPYASVGVLPRGHRALLAGGKVFVSLNAISVDYAVYGTGRIVVIDPATDSVTGVVDLPGVKNCGAMTYVAAAQRLVVACAGAYGDPAGQAASSAVVAIDVGQAVPAVAAQVLASSIGKAPFSNLTVAALDGGTALAIATGDFSGTPPDSLWSLPLDGKAAVKVFDSTEAFALGAVLFDSTRSRVFLADALSLPGSVAYLRTFDLAAGVFAAGKTVKTNPTQKLPPRALAFY